jgi:hypothetical protein
MAYHSPPDVEGSRRVSGLQIPPPGPVHNQPNRGYPPRRVDNPVGLAVSYGAPFVGFHGSQLQAFVF